jgi:hypothetical protein
MVKSPWEGVLRSLGTTPHAARSLQGITGYSHAFAGIGVDPTRRRLILIAAESDPRILAMAQADIQAVDSSYHVIAVRPVVIDSDAVWREPADPTQWLLWERLAPLVTSGTADADLLSGDALLGSLMRPLFEKLSKIDSGSITPDSPDVPVQQDPFERDRRLGICPIPLYQLTESELETILSGMDVEAIRHVLRRLDVLQYFFPPPDQLALGLVDTLAGKHRSILDVLSEAPKIGHPFGETELVRSDTSVADLLDTLSAQNLVVDGEYSFELTPTGQSIRAVMRFKPRESFLAKLLNRVSVSLNLKDLFGGSA